MTGQVGRGVCGLIMTRSRVRGARPDHNLSTSLRTYTVTD